MKTSIKYVSQTTLSAIERVSESKKTSNRPQKIPSKRKRRYRKNGKSANLIFKKIKKLIYFIFSKKCTATTPYFINKKRAQIELFHLTIYVTIS